RIDRAAGGVGHDHGHGPRRPVLRARRAERPQQERDRGDGIRPQHAFLLRTRERFARRLYDRVCASDCVAEPRRFQSALMPAAWIGFAQRSISAGRYLARYSGVRRSGATISMPSSSSRRRMGGASGGSLIAWWSWRRTGWGGLWGKKTASQTLASTPGTLCSRVVATWGMIGPRFSAITAMALTAPCLACAAPFWMVEHK